jgi:hypothetical protein
MRSPFAHFRWERVTIIQIPLFFATVLYDDAFYLCNRRCSFLAG